MRSGAQAAVAVARRLGAALPLTRLGRGVAALTVVAWTAAAALGWIEAALVAAVGVSLLVVALPFLFRRAAMTCELRVDPIRLTVGSPALGTVIVRNTGKLRSMPRRIDVAVGDATVPIDTPSLAAGGTFEQPFVVPTDRRAVVRVGPATIVRGDPLGVYYRALEHTGSLDVYVHPRRVPLPALPAGFVRDLEGPTFDNSPRGDVEFHTLREYVHGDDVRHIHWPSLARIGTLMVRQYVDNRQPQMLVLVDASPDSYAEDSEFEVAMEIVGSLDEAAVRAGQAITHWVGTARRAGQRLDVMLDALSSATLEPEAHVLGMVPRALAKDGAATVAVLVTGSTAPVGEVPRALQSLSRAAWPVAAQIGGEAVGANAATWGVTMHVRSVEDFARRWAKIMV